MYIHYSILGGELFPAIFRSFSHTLALTLSLVVKLANNNLRSIVAACTAALWDVWGYWQFPNETSKMNFVSKIKKHLLLSIQWNERECAAGTQISEIDEIESMLATEAGLTEGMPKSRWSHASGLFFCWASRGSSWAELEEIFDDLRDLWMTTNGILSGGEDYGHDRWG